MDEIDEVIKEANRAIAQLYLYKAEQERVRLKMAVDTFIWCAKRIMETDFPEAKPPVVTLTPESFRPMQMQDELNKIAANREASDKLPNRIKNALARGGGDLGLVVGRYPHQVVVRDAVARAVETGRIWGVRLIGKHTVNVIRQWLKDTSEETP